VRKGLRRVRKDFFAAFAVLSALCDTFFVIYKAEEKPIG